MCVFAPTRLYGRVVYTYLGPGSDLVFYYTAAIQRPGTFYGTFFFASGYNGRYSGHSYQIWLLNCIQTHIKHSATSPFLCTPSNASRSIFPVCCLSGEDSNERSTAQRHALLIALLNEVIHNVTTLPYTHTESHTCTHILLCLPQDILEAESIGMGWRKVNLTG